MPTQEQMDDLVTAAQAVGTAQRAVDEAVAAFNRSNAVSNFADMLITALETNAASPEDLETLLTLQFEWKADTATKGTAFSNANTALGTAQSNYATALAAASS